MQPEPDSRPAESATSAKARREVRFRREISLAVVLGSMLLTAVIAHFGLGIERQGGQLAAIVAGAGLLVFLGVQFVRFRQRVSLRTLLLVVTVLAVGLAWFGWQLSLARDETAAVEHLLQLGASATYASDQPRQGDKYFHTESGWRLPIWLYQLLGKDFFIGVDRISFEDSQITDVDLSLLSQVRRVRAIDFSAEQITADGLAEMPVVPGLQEICLEWRQVSAASIRRLARCPDLKSVTMLRPRYNVAPTTGQLGIWGFPPARRPTRPPDDVASLGQLQQVERLTVWVGSYTPEWMGELARLPELRELNLHGDMAPFSPEAVQRRFDSFDELAKSSTIREVNIWDLDEFSDGDLTAFCYMSALEILRIDRSRITVNGVRAFRKARPSVKLVITPLSGMTPKEFNEFKGEWWDWLHPDQK